MAEKQNIKEWNLNPYAGGGWFCQYKMMQKNWKMTEILAHGYSPASTPRELSSIRRFKISSASLPQTVQH